MAGEPVWSAPGRDLPLLKPLDGHLPSRAMAAGAGHRGLGRREVTRPARFREEEEITRNARSRTQIPVPVRRPASEADPPSPRPRPRLSVLGAGVPTVRVFRTHGGGDDDWTSEVIEGAELTG